MFKTCLFLLCVCVCVCDVLAPAAAVPECVCVCVDVCTVPTLALSECVIFVEERGLMLGAAVELIRGVPGELGRCYPQLPALLSGPLCRLVGPSATALHLHTLH